MAIAYRFNNINVQQTLRAHIVNSEGDVSAPVTVPS